MRPTRTGPARLKGKGVFLAGFLACAAFGLAGPGIVAAANPFPPGPPQNVTAVTWQIRSGWTTEAVEVEWDPGVANGSPISSYFAQAVPQASGPGATCTAGSHGSNCVLDPDLPIGVPYQIYVYAFNLGGQGPPGVAQYTPTYQPDTPQNLAARVLSYGGGGATVSVSWASPAHDGGLPITAYHLQTVSNGQAGPRCDTSGALSCTLAGMSPGATYTITVDAQNGDGTSTWAGLTYTVPAEPVSNPTPTPTPTPTRGQTASATPGASRARAEKSREPSAGIESSASAEPSASPMAVMPAAPGGSSGESGLPAWLLALGACVLIALATAATLLGLRLRRRSSAHAD